MQFKVKEIMEEKIIKLKKKITYTIKRKKYYFNRLTNECRLNVCEFGGWKDLKIYLMVFSGHCFCRSTYKDYLSCQKISGKI